MKVAKEIFIMALLLMIVVFMIGLVFYEYMPNNKIIPDATSYSADSSTTSVLQEIAATSANSGDDDSSSGVDDVLLQSYSIGAQELSTAASKHSYTSGKTNPFAEYVDPNVNMVNNTTVNGTTTAQPTTAPQQTTGGSASNKNSSNSGSSSTGSFFEKPNSK